MAIVNSEKSQVSADGVIIAEDLLVGDLNDGVLGVGGVHQIEGVHLCGVVAAVHHGPAGVEEGEIEAGAVHASDLSSELESGA